MTDLIVLPFIFIMLTGFLIIPWLTPITAIVVLGQIFRTGHYRQSLLSITICLYGVLTTIGIWFYDSLNEINTIVENPEYFIFPQLLFLILGIREQARSPCLLNGRHSIT